MLAMQYTIQLPANYGDEKIRARVEDRSKLFDEHKGLLHKSFLYNQKDRLYAPFYVWKDVVEAQEFLMDDLFKGVIEAFSRHRVRSWFSIHHAYGDKSLKPKFALREIDVIAPEDRLDNFLANEKKLQDKLTADPNLYMHLVGIDADRWEIMRFSLWKDAKSAHKPASDSFIEYEVLHVSQPKA